MKLVIGKNGKIELASQNEAQAEWTNVWGIEPPSAGAPASAQSSAPASGPAVNVQTIRMTEPLRRPFNPFFLINWLQQLNADLGNQLSFFFGMGRTSAAHKESVRKNLISLTVCLLVLGALALTLANYQQQKTSEQVAADSQLQSEKAADSDTTGAVEAEQFPDEIASAEGGSSATAQETPLADEQGESPLADEPVSEEAPAQSSFGQAPFILPPAPQPGKAKEPGAAGAQSSQI